LPALPIKQALLAKLTISQAHVSLSSPAYKKSKFDYKISACKQRDKSHF
jgi:hypothetical protein